VVECQCHDLIVQPEGAQVFTAIHFKNFKVLKDATLPLGRCTLIVGPNGSGKSTALSSLQLLANRSAGSLLHSRSAAANENAPVEIDFKWSDGNSIALMLTAENQPYIEVRPKGATLRPEFEQACNSSRVYRLDSRSIAEAGPLQERVVLEQTGRRLAAVLDGLSTRYEDRWATLNERLPEWFPEFDRIRLSVESGTSNRTFSMRLKGTNREIAARDLSDGVLLSIALFTLAYLPDAPALIGLEEPERGIHPRLLQEVFLTLQRLAHPEEFGESRVPVQVIATTHSPYLLGYFRDRPEDVVIANREGDNVRFERLADIANYDEIVGDVSLGEAWYTGVFGGVPTQ